MLVLIFIAIMATQVASALDYSQDLNVTCIICSACPYSTFNSTPLSTCPKGLFYCQTTTVIDFSVGDSPSVAITGTCTSSCLETTAVDSDKLILIACRSHPTRSPPGFYACLLLALFVSVYLNKPHR